MWKAMSKTAFDARRSTTQNPRPDSPQRVGAGVSESFRVSSASLQRQFRIGYIIFTSMLTPLGKLRLVSASMTFGEGLRMSISRLCTRISNCSRAFL